MSERTVKRDLEALQDAGIEISRDPIELSKERAAYARGRTGHRTQQLAAERLSGRPGRPFVEATRDHARPHWKFRAAIPERSIAIFRFAVSAPRPTATPSAIDT